MISAQTILRVVEPIVFGRKLVGLAVLTALTAWLGWHASQVEVDAGFDKQLPQSHPYMATFNEYKDAFGGANLISIALLNHEGDIYNEKFLERLKKVTDEIFFLPGVDRSRVTSLFTPGVRYIEIVEGGFKGGDVVPRNYEPSPQMFQQIRDNVGKAGIIGRLVSTDQRGAMIVAELLEIHPSTGEKLDYREVAAKLEEIRDKYEDAGISVHIIGFAKIVGNVTDAAGEVVMFFAIALLLTALLLRVYSASWKLSALPLACSLVAVVWEFGLLHIFGMGLDPFAILVPFLVLANGVEHGIQMVNAWADEITNYETDSHQAAVNSFRRVAIPGTAALMTDVFGFVTIALIDIQIIQEMALNAAFGMAAIIITNKWLMPILLTYIRIANPEEYKRRLDWREGIGNRFWKVIARTTEKRNAIIILIMTAGLLAWGLWKGQDIRIGDTQEGVPELRPDSRYNHDSRVITEHFRIGVDQLKVMAEAEPQACIQHEVLDLIDRFAWRMQNTPGVDSVQALPQIAKHVRKAWNEGSPKWAVLPRNQYAIVQAISPVPSSAGLQNPDCSVMPVLVFTENHKAETLETIFAAAEQFRAEVNAEYDGKPPVNFALASGNVGVMAATNEVIKAEEKPILFWVYAAVGLMCWLSFRSLSAIICIMTPLAVVSLVAYAVMAVLDIGLKVATLPVAALAVGIGIDFGIYTFSVLQDHLDDGMPLKDAYYRTLQLTGKAVAFTGVALSIGVITWIWSDLQFQRDMGLLMVFMFLANMIGALFVLPALAVFFARPAKHAEGTWVRATHSDKG